MFILFIFLPRLKMYSQNEETGILEVLENNFLHCPTMVGGVLQNFFKIFSVDFTIQW